MKNNSLREECVVTPKGGIGAARAKRTDLTLSKAMSKKEVI